jgi:hypothetical protein
MKPLRPHLQDGRWVESAFGVAIFIAILWCAGHLWVHHYLPQPFFYNRNDTYADWFNTASWARDIGSHDSWKSIYPPLSFVFLRFVGIDSCYTDPSGGELVTHLRSCDKVGLSAIWLIFLLNVALVWRIFRKLDPKTAVPRTLCVGLGFPMLDGVERGNLMLITFTCLLLALGPILRSARLRWLFAGLAVNFKVYLIAAFIPLLVKRRWRWVEGALISIVLVYMFTYAILGHGTPGEIVTNIVQFSSGTIGSIMDIWHATNYRALLGMMSEGTFPFTILIGSKNVDLVLFAVPLVQRLVQLTIVAAVAATWLRPESVPAYRLVALGLLLAMITSDAGLYSMAYFMLFVMMEPWRGIGRRWAIVACYVLALPLDIPIDVLPETPQDLYIGNEIALIPNEVTFGPLVRPFIVMTIGLALSLTTLREVWLDIRLQGWAGRWRLRRDAPLLPGVRRPVPWNAE